MCKLCMKQYYKDNFSTIAAGKRKAYYADPRKQKAINLKRNFNISIEKFDDMLQRQENACLICGKQFSKDFPPFVDHNHSCCPMKAKSCGHCVRALLCLHCNAGLGNFRDNTELLSKATQYLKSFTNNLTTDHSRGKVITEYGKDQDGKAKAEPEGQAEASDGGAIGV